MRILPVAVLALAGCLPAYDNALPSTGSELGVPDGGSDAAFACMPSGKKLGGVVLSAETGLAVASAVMSLEGFPEAQFKSAPSDSLGHWSLDIPDCVLNTGRYLIIDGTASSIPMMQTWLGPATFGAVADPMRGVHGFENPSDPTRGSKHLVVKELVAAGLFPSEAAFNASYSYMQSTLVSVAGQLTRFNNYVLQVTDGTTVLDNTGCSTPGKAATQCCVFYLSGLYDDFINGRAGATYVKLGDTKANGFNFVITCPGNGAMPGTKAREITVTQTAPTASLRDSNQMPPNADFTPIVAPVVVGDVVGYEWQIFQ